MAVREMFKLLLFTFIIFCFMSTLSIEPVRAQGLLESIRNGIQNVIRPRQERNRETRLANNSTSASSKDNKSNVQSQEVSPSNTMQNTMRNPIHYPVFVPALSSSSWMSASSRAPTSSDSISPSVDYTTSSTGDWPGTEAPFGMEVYDEDQLMAHKDSLLKRQKESEESPRSQHSPSIPVSSSHHTPYQPPEYSSSEESRQPAVPEATHHSSHERVADDGRPRSMMYNTPPFASSSSTSTSYIDHSPSSSSPHASSAFRSSSSRQSVSRHFSPVDTRRSPIIGQLYDNRPMASEHLFRWADASIIAPSSTAKSSLHSSVAAFTTSEALASAELL